MFYYQIEVYLDNYDNPHQGRIFTLMNNLNLENRRQFDLHLTRVETQLMDDRFLQVFPLQP